MPKIYRMMKMDGDRPATGPVPMTLGVRLPGGKYRPDIHPDGDGCVAPGGGGMSVNPSAQHVLSSLPPTRIPLRFRKIELDAAGVPRAAVPGARGDEAERLFIWSMGNGPFIAAPVAPLLQLAPDEARSAAGPAHGVVEPYARVETGEYVAALEATRDQWMVDEE